MKFNLELFPYQEEDVKFMHDHPRCINGNAMGLGKTIEALRLTYELDPRHVLVVATKTLVPEWWNHIDSVLEEECLTPHDYGDKLAGLDLKGPRFVCVNYDLLAIPDYWGKLYDVNWNMIIFDEAHKMKNPKANRTKNAYLLVPEVPRIVLMSGTPQQNGPQDLFSLLHIINPRRYRSYNTWTNLFCEKELMTLMIHDKTLGKKVPRQFKQIVGAKNQDKLRDILSLYMIRHEKEDVLHDLPPKQFRTVPVKLSTTEYQRYKQMERDYFATLDSGELVTSPNALAKELRLRQLCLDSNLLSKDTERTSSYSTKTQALLEIIDGCDSKVVVFSHFEQYINIVSQELGKREISHVKLTGQTSTTQRGQVKYAFQNDPSVKVFLGTIGAGGEGIDLFASSTCIFTDLHWNPMQNNQAEDRLHRIGQHDSVLIIDLWCQNTVEDHVHAVVRHKEQMFNEVVTRKAVIDRMRENWRFN